MDLRLEPGLAKQRPAGLRSRGCHRARSRHGRADTPRWAPSPVLAAETSASARATRSRRRSPRLDRRSVSSCEAWRRPVQRAGHPSPDSRVRTSGVRTRYFEVNPESRGHRQTHPGYQRSTSHAPVIARALHRRHSILCDRRTARVLVGLAVDVPVGRTSRQRPARHAGVDQGQGALPVRARSRGERQHHRRAHRHRCRADHGQGLQHATLRRGRRAPHSLQRRAPRHRRSAA